MDCSPPGSSVHGILQARILEWVAISFSRGFSQPMALVSPELADWFFTTESPGKLHTRVLSCFSLVWLFVALWTITHQAPQSMGFSRQEYWSGWPCPPGDLPDPGIEIESPVSPALQEDSLLLSHWGSPREAPDTINKTNQTKIVLSVFLLTLGMWELWIHFQHKNDATLWRPFWRNWVAAWFFQHFFLFYPLLWFVILPTWPLLFSQCSI